MTDEKFKAYFYIGFEEPALIATDIEGLKNTIIYDNYIGDVSENLVETINSCASIEELKEELAYYDVYINPTKQTFIESNKAWFDNNSLETNLKNW